MPDFIQPTATVKMLPARSSSRFPHIKKDHDGNATWPDPDDYTPKPKQATCLLCGVVGGDIHRVQGQNVLAHAQCVAALQRSVGQPAKPVRKALPQRPQSKQAAYTDEKAAHIMSQALDEYPQLREAVGQELARRMSQGGR